MAFVLLAAGMAPATSPSRILLSYNDSARVLTVVARHPTLSPLTHHVALMSVQLNDSLVAEQRFTGQTSNQEQAARFAIPEARAGDQVRVTAVCNLFGRRTEALVLRASDQ